jgi:hypothetical protein
LPGLYGFQILIPGVLRAGVKGEQAVQVRKYRGAQVPRALRVSQPIKPFKPTLGEMVAFALAEWVATRALPATPQP